MIRLINDYIVHKKLLSLFSRLPNYYSMILLNNENREIIKKCNENALDDVVFKIHPLGKSRKYCTIYVMYKENSLGFIK